MLVSNNQKLICLKKSLIILKNLFSQKYNFFNISYSVMNNFFLCNLYFIIFTINNEIRNWKLEIGI
ncbi:MAG: hypothetical protein DRJ01_07265 [Bacteroidetes bacterium]|nr:MAG: hypothetical protein DRJ01_07265 [Bacteroidota bacterium]